MKKRPSLKFSRRSFLYLAVAPVVLPALSRIVDAQDYPTRPVRLIVGVPPGGPADMIARLMGQWLSEQLHQPFIVDNRPGAATNLGTEAAVRATPDGYTLLLVTAINASNTALYDDLNFNFVQDIAPVASIDRFPLVMVVNASFPAETVPDFIAYAKANPGEINFASIGIGSTQHLAGELLKMMADINMVAVQYQGDAPALIDLIGGRVQVYFGPLPGSIGYIRAGKLRALAVTTVTRSEALPDIPTLGDFVPGYEASGWQGIGAPRNTSSKIINELNAQINAGLADHKIRERLAELGGTALALSPANFGKLIVEDVDKWRKVIRAVKIKPE